MKTIETARKTKLEIYFIMMIIFLFISCTFYYKTSDLRSSFSTVEKELNKTLTMIESDHDQKTEMFNHLISTIPDQLIKPYPAMSTSLNELFSMLNQLKGIKTQLDNLKDQFDTLIKGKKKIETNTSDWTKIKDLKNKYKNKLQDFENLSNNYSITSNSFNSLAEKHGVAKIDVSDLKKRIDLYLKDLDEYLQAISKGISVSRQKLTNAKSNGMRQNKINQKENILTKMEAIAGNITLLRNRIGLMVIQFENEFKNDDESWSGPGMQSHTIISNMTSTGDQIRKKGGKINDLAKSL